MKKLFTQFVQEESGQDMIEYVLILGFVCVGAAAIVTSVGDSIGSIFSTANEHLSNAAVKAATPK